MKRNKKIISLILAVILLISSSVIVQADSISISAELLLTGLNDASVTQAVKNYFEKRANYLLGVSETLDGTVIGIVNDEASHLEQYAHEGITLTGCTYQIDSVDCYDACAEVTVTETVAYTQNGTAKTEEVVHNLNVYLDCNDTPIVAADAYIERCSDFASCSYVMPITQTFAVSLTGGSGCCAVEIALGEVGYSVSEGGTSKYGTGAWCGNL